MSKYRLSPKPGIIRVNKSITIRTAPSLPKRNGVISVRSRATKPAHKLKQRQAVPSTPVPRSAHERPNTKKADRIIRRHRKHEVVNPRRRTSSVLRDRQRDILSKYTDKVRNLRDVGKGKVLVIVACGPSILQAEIGRLKNHPLIDTMSINKPDKRVWPSTYWVFCDYSQYNRNREIWDPYRGTILNPSSMRARHPNQILIKNLGGKGFSKNLLKGYHIGRSTTFANMQTALWMNYDKIYIFGCDMTDVNGRMHYYGQNPDVEDANRMKRFGTEAEYYMHAADTMTEVERAKFVFCSSYNKWPFVKKFQQLDQTKAVDHILSNI